MKIAHVTATFPPDYNGTANVCYHDAFEVARLGHEVHVFTSEYPLDGYRDPAEFCVHRLPAFLRVGNAPVNLSLFSALKGFDVLHLHYPFYFGAEMVFLRSVLDKTPYVITYHQDVRLKGLLEPAIKLHNKTLGRLILGSCSRLFVTSWDYALNSGIKDIVISKGDDAAEVPNGVDVVRFDPRTSGGSIRERHGIENGEQVVLFVGALDSAHYFKGINVLLESLLKLNRPDTKLVVVGDGNMRQEYISRAAALGLTDRVVFAGRVSADELPSYYAMSNLLVLPSTTEGEAFGLVLVEAMACGKPVIASDLPGVRSVVDEGITGLLAKPGSVGDLVDKIGSLLSQPDVMTRMGIEGRKKAETRYAWHNIGLLLERLYEEVLEGRATTSIRG